MSVLVIEDNKDEMLIMTRILKQHGVNSFQAFSIEEALDILDKENNIGVICLDLNLGNTHGFEFLEKRKTSEKLSNIPVVVLTFYADKSTIKVALVKGADSYLIKPVQDDLLIEMLKKLEIIQ